MMCADAAGSCLQVLQEAITPATSLVVASRNTALPVVRKQLAKLSPEVGGAAVRIFIHAHLQQAPPQGSWPLCWKALACGMVCCWHWQVVKHWEPPQLPLQRPAWSRAGVPCVLSASCRMPAGETHCCSTFALSVLKTVCRCLAEGALGLQSIRKQAAAAAGPGAVCRPRFLGKVRAARETSGPH